MKNILLTLLFTLALLIFCQPAQSSQYLITLRWPADSIEQYQREYQPLKPGLHIEGNNGLLLGMVSHVAFRNNSVDVTIMLDKKIPIGSEISYSPCFSPRISIEYSKQHKYYCPGDIITSDVPPMAMVKL